MYLEDQRPERKGLQEDLRGRRNDDGEETIMVLRVRPSDLQEKTKLKKIIDKQTHMWNERRVQERIAAGKSKRSLYASDYGQCMRKVWYQFFPERFEQPAMDPRVLRIFHNGEDVHVRLSSYLKSEPNLEFEEEIDVPRDELDVHGRCDGICLLDGRFVVTEFKSINRKTVYEPKDEHKGQLMWYMSMWKKYRKELKERFGLKEHEAMLDADIFLTDEELTKFDIWLLQSQGDIRGEIIYESKQTNETFHFVIEYDQDYADKVRMWFQQLKWHVDNDIRPEVLYDKSKFPCQWGSGSSHGKCPYFDTCWGSE